MKIRRKARRSAPAPGLEVHSAYAASLGAPDQGRYRRTPDGQPTVAELVLPGATICTSYGTGGVVVRLEQWTFTAESGEDFPHHTIVYAYVPPARQHRYRDSDLHWIGECVAVGGRIVKLFEANADEVFVEVPAAPPARAPPTILIT